MPEFIEVKMINFPQFEKFFWNKENKQALKKKCDSSNINALTVWSEIMSFIKGSPESYLSDNWHLAKKQYLDYVGVHKTTVSIDTKDQIWELANLYEHWKTSEYYFDMMDIVTYLTTQILKVFFFFN